MKRLLEAYTNFTRTERIGIMGLCSAIVLLLMLKALIPNLVQPQRDEAKEKELIAAWNNIKTMAHPDTSGQQITTKQDQETFTTENNKTMAHPDPSGQQITTISPAASIKTGNSTALFAFDPNTIDSTGLRKLGLREKTTAIFMNWRRKGKRFYQKEEFSKLYTLSSEEYKRLESYITINNKLNSRNYNFEDEYGPLPATIELNKADSITLIRLKGIGPRLAHRILEKRRAVGAFTSHAQLREIYNFSDSTFKMLQERLIIN